MKIYKVKFGGVYNGTDIKVRKYFTEKAHAMNYLEKLQDDYYTLVTEKGWDCSESRDSKDNLLWFTLVGNTPATNCLDGEVTEVDVVEDSGKRTYEVCIHYIATKTLKVEAYDNKSAIEIARGNAKQAEFDDEPFVSEVEVEILD